MTWDVEFIIAVSLYRIIFFLIILLSTDCFCLHSCIERDKVYNTVIKTYTRSINIILDSPTLLMGAVHNSSTIRHEFQDNML
jgi:hypothetical protein